ncbi:EAL domain-containing protein [Svornostia abyssi]|uniref:EAL domain-containing protein n=1 Tax=Svornostia abyssi TaxID=2898438 RepID=A0ABY5PFL7_9ACTN|nr:EAL domain-containing protein [Parviterribacteraceae bacterium J379]
MSEHVGRSSAAGPVQRERWEFRAAVLVLFVLAYVGGAAWGIELAERSGISPWYPPAGLSLALVILLGPRWAPAIVVADLAQWALVGGRGTFLVATAFAVSQALIFAGAGAVLRRSLRAEPPLTRLGDLAMFGAVGVVAAPLLAALSVMGIDLLANDLPPEDFFEQVRIFFIGDAVAIVALTPALLTFGAWVQGVSLRAASPRAEGITAEDALMAVAVVILPPALLFAFDDRLIFVSLLPLAWIALRRGLPAASVGISVWATVTVLGYDLFDPEVALVEVQSFLLSGGALALASGAVVSERERGRARLAYLALHDDITGLPNRHRLMEALTDALAREERRSVAILVVQLRGLRQILAGVGREALDELLAAIADKLRSITGPDATLARLSPARFVVMLDGPGADRAEAIADRILAELASPMELDGRELALDASIGVAYGARDAGPDAVLARADAATARAARQTGSRRVLFDATLEAEARDRRDLERRLRDAIDAETLHLAFQPVVELESGRVVDAEALARWTPPGGDPIPPNVFIPIAEDTGLILRLGRWVLQAACRHAVTWPDAGGLPIGVSVNVSPMQLQDAGFVDDVRAALGAAGLPASRLRIEVTESILLDDLETAIARLAELRELGVTAMLDDFGTGYSSLSWVQRLPVTSLKVDRSFVAGLADGAVDHAIVTATIGLARALHLGTVAEGVETERQREILRQLGCGRMQGFLIAEPMPGDLFLTWLEGRSRRRSA